MLIFFMSLGIQMESSLSGQCYVRWQVLLRSSFFCQGCPPLHRSYPQPVMALVFLPRVDLSLNGEPFLMIFPP